MIIQIQCAENVGRMEIFYIAILLKCLCKTKRYHLYIYSLARTLDHGKQDNIKVI